MFIIKEVTLTRPRLGLFLFFLLSFNCLYTLCLADCEVDNPENGRWIYKSDFTADYSGNGNCLFQGPPTQDSIMPYANNGGLVYVIKGKYKAMFGINATPWSKEKPPSKNECAIGYARAYAKMVGETHDFDTYLGGTLIQHQDPNTGEITYSRIFDYVAKVWEWEEESGNCIDKDANGGPPSCN